MIAIDPLNILVLKCGKVAFEVLLDRNKVVFRVDLFLYIVASDKQSLEKQHALVVLVLGLSSNRANLLLLI